MTTLNSFYAQAAALTNLDQRRWALGAAYRLGEYVGFGYSIAAARTLVSAVPQYANGMVAAGLDDDYALIDDVGSGPPPAPTGFVVDTFTDGGAPLSLELHTGETGATWAEHPTYTAGNTTVAVDGTAYSTAATSALYASGLPATADYDVAADFVALTDAGTTGITGRMDTTAASFYMARYLSGTGWQLYRVLAGAASLIGSSAAAIGVATRRVTLRMRGTTISVLIDGAQVISVTNTEVAGPGRAGIRNDSSAGISTGVHLDNFTATNA